MLAIVAPHRWRGAILALVLVSHPAAAGAQEASPSATPAITPPASAEPIATGPEGEWNVAAYDAWEQGLTEPLPDSSLTLRLLDGGQLEGETGCGRFNGGWSLDGDELFMGVAPTGNLGCGERLVAEAIGLSTALAAVTGWQAADGGVELLDATGATRLVLERAALADPVGSWSVERYRRPNGKLVEPLPDRPMSLTLLADATLEGSTGCRLLLGQFRHDGAGMALGPLESEGRPCEREANRAERQFLRALGDVVYWEREGERLVLLDGFDEVLVELVQVTEPTASAGPET